MARSQYIDFDILMLNNRACELPGTYNPLVVTELFQEQCKPGEGLILGFMFLVLHTAKVVIQLALEHATNKYQQDHYDWDLP